MEWDYDKLFAVGNYIGVKNPNSKKIMYEPIEYDDVYDWYDYKNENLTSSLDKNWIVYRIIQLNNEGEITNVVFDREKDMPKPMPELKTGMFVDVKGSGLGVVVSNKVVYRDGGFDFCNLKDDLYDSNVNDSIVKVWENCNSFAGCLNQKPDWEKSK